MTTSTLTATQLRNARKRRALKRTKNGASSSETATATAPSNKKKRTRPTHSARKFVDPSQQFIENPYAAPTVKAAQKFFQNIFQQQWKKKSKIREYDKCKEFRIHLGPKLGWRTLVKLPVRGENPPKIGIFVPGSHQILPVVDPQTQQCLCTTHHPAINRAIVVLQRVLNQSAAVTAYSEQTGQGLLRHVALSLERHTQRVQLVLVWNDDNKEKSSFVAADMLNRGILKTLWQALVSYSNPSSGKGDSSSPSSSSTEVQWHSIWVHYNTLWKHSNAIYDIDGPWELLYPSPSRPGSAKEEAEDSMPPLGVTEYLISEEEDRMDDHPSKLLRVPLYFPPQVFRQGNLTAFAKIVFSIRCYWIQSGLNGVDKCLELYGGVGTIGLHVVDLFRGELIGSDENPYNVACFEASARTLRGVQKHAKEDRVRYISASASEMVLERQEHLSANVILVDPPRKGLGAAVAHSLTWSAKPSPPPSSGVNRQTLFYVSCGFEAFTRDYAVLTDPSAPTPWTLQHAEGHILFPGSDAIETLAIFIR